MLEYAYVAPITFMLPCFLSAQVNSDSFIVFLVTPFYLDLVNLGKVLSHLCLGTLLESFNSKIAGLSTRVEIVPIYLDQ